MGKLSVEAQAKAKKWLEKNGFDEKGYTYVLVGLNSYEIKEQLKDAGWVYSPVLRWHNSVPGDFPQNVKCFHWTCLFELMAYGDFVPFPDTQSKIDGFIQDAMPESTSQYVGEIGDRLKKIPVTFVRRHGFTGAYGYTEVLSFKDEKGNSLSWFTSVNPDIEPNTKCILSGTVKKHEEYRGEKITYLTRCRLYKAE